MFSPSLVPGLAALSQLSPVAESGQERFLQVALGQGWVGVLALDRLQEVIRVPLEEILPLPGLEPWVLGVRSWRGDIVWIVDLAALLGLGSLSESGDLALSVSALVIPSGEQMLGVVVERVETIAVLDPRSLQPLTPGLVPAGLARYLRGHFIDDQGQMLLLLEVEALDHALGEICP